MGRVALVVGRNDSGKSNLLRLLVDHLHDFHRLLATPGQPSSKFSVFDTHMPPCEAQFSLRVPRAGIIEPLVDKTASTLGNEAADRAEALHRLLDSPVFSDEHDHEFVWFTTAANQLTGDWGVPGSVVRVLMEDKSSTNTWFGLQQAIESRRTGVEDAIREIYPRIYGYAVSRVPRVSLIPSVREVREVRDGGTAENDDHSGAGLVSRLQELQNPGPTDSDKRHQWEDINGFVQTVLENESARLEVPFREPDIIVNMDGRRLPLERKGSGVHEVIILAAAATVLTEQIVCIEEPELHLHPSLQRKLLRYLQEHTSNQYIISTHSAHILDLPGVTLHHVVHDGQTSSLSNVASADDHFSICRDLGYRPSDLLQANCVVWVEGPSDRLYVNYWLREVAPELQEGLEYSIMFYGGKLLSHLTGVGERLAMRDDLIRLPVLNRHSAILIDSDRSGKEKSINATKARIRKEFNDRGGVAWVSQGREIENYLPRPALEAAIARVHPGARQPDAMGPYDRVLAIKKKGEDVAANKVAIAREVTTHPVDLGVLDLDRRIRQLADFIRTANEPRPAPES